MLLASESNAFGMQEQCFWCLKAMLLGSESYAQAVSSFKFIVLSPLHSESGIAERLVYRAEELRVKCCAQVSGVGSDH